MIRAFAAVAVIGVLAACAGGPSSQTRVAQCLAVVSVPMLYPSNGATGIPDGNFDLYAAYMVNPAQIWGPPVLSASNRATANGTAFTPAQGSPPNSATPPPGSQEYVSHIPALAASTTYTVTLPGGGCGGAGLGSFTTQ